MLEIASGVKNLDFAQTKPTIIKINNIRTCCPTCKNAVPMLQIYSNVSEMQIFYYDKACSKSFKISSICSVPIESLMVLGFMPDKINSSGVICECVVEAG